MYTDLSKKQLEILNFIKQQIKNVGYPPSVREICKGVNLKSTSTVHGHVNTLEKKGYIRKDPTKPRAIEVLSLENEYDLPSKETVNVPIVGNVAAGSPMLAFEDIEDTYPVSKELIKNKDVFMLRIQGESMIDVGIFHGDLVLVEKSSTAENGDIIVALLDNEATVKKFYKEKDHIKLEPANSLMSPIYTRDVKVLGRVKALYRVI